MENIFPLTLAAQQLTNYLTTHIMFAMLTSDDKRTSVEEYIAAESDNEVIFVTEYLQYIQSSHLQFAHYLATHLLREEDRREHRNWVEHVETKLLSRLQNRLNRCMCQSNPEIGEVYFLEDVVSSLNRWIVIQKANAQIRQRAYAEANGLIDIQDLYVL